MFLSMPQSLTSLCHLDQLLLVTHINLSSNQLQRLPPQFAMLQCLEVMKLQSKCLSLFVLMSGLEDRSETEHIEFSLQINNSSTLAGFGS